MGICPFIRRIDVSAENNALLHFARRCSLSDNVTGFSLRKKRVEKFPIHKKFTEHTDKSDGNQNDRYNRQFQKRKDKSQKRKNSVDDNPRHECERMDIKVLDFHVICTSLHFLGKMLLSLSLGVIGGRTRSECLTDFLDLPDCIVRIHPKGGRIIFYTFVSFHQLTPFYCRFSQKSELLACLFYHV